MGWLLGLGLAAGAAGIVAKKIKDHKNKRKKEAENIATSETKQLQAAVKKREDYTFSFNDVISEDKFEKIVEDIAKRIPRISAWASGHKVYGDVESNSRLSKSSFIIDFNDYGELTGRYWVWKANDDSQAVDKFAQQIKEKVEEILESSDDEYCPYCNAHLTSQEGFSSDYAGWRCHNCNEMVYAPWVYSGERFEGTYWVCDKCRALLNVQDGFRDLYDHWKCVKCGHVNDINVDEIKD